MKKTILFFSPEGGSVNRVTLKLGAMIGDDKVEIIPVVKATKEDLDRYEQIILLGSTVGTDHWSNEAVPDEWPAFFSKMEESGFEAKKVAIVGLGNSVLYPDHFADGMAILYRAALDRKAVLFGSVDSSGYDFTDSEALNEEGLFCGLAVDEDNEEELTDERLENWLAALKTDFDF